MTELNKKASDLADVVRLHEQGLSHTAIGARSGVSAGAVYQRLRQHGIVQTLGARRAERYAAGEMTQRERLGYWLRQLRERSGLTQAQAEQALYWSTSQVSKTELGIRLVRPVDVRDILRVYGVTQDATVRKAEETALAIRDEQRRARAAKRQEKQR
jgi:hypothetical protein